MAGEIYFNNLTGRFDWGSIIDQIIKIKSLPIQRLSKEAEQIKAKQTALQKLITAINDFSKLFENLDVDSLFKGKRVDISDSSILGATATEKTPNVSLNINVNQLAQKEMLITNQGISDINSTISWSDFTLAYNRGDTYLYFNINGGSGKLSDLVDSINNSPAGEYIMASIFYDGNSYRLMLSEKDEGKSLAETSQSEATVISFAAFPYINGVLWDIDRSNPLQKAQNAQISIGSNTLISATNRFENLLPGLNVEVKKIGSSTLTISNDYSKASDLLKGFVKGYNAVISLVNQLTDKDALFQGDYTISGIKSELSRKLDDLLTYDLVDIKEDGTLELKNSSVNSLNPQILKGIISKLKDNVGIYLSKTSQAFQSFNNDLQSRLDRITSRVEELGRQIIKEEERLRLEYAKVEAFINKAQETMARIQAFIVSLSEMQGGKK